MTLVHDELDIRYSIDGKSPFELVHFFSNVEKDLPPGAVNPRLYISAYDEYGSSVAEVKLEYQRPQTDAEAKEEEEYVKRQLNWKRVQLAALKKELGDA